IDQSLHSRLGAETTNGDGFGVGWYGEADTPGVYRSIEPAWNDRNLRELAAHISTPFVLAHIRAALGSLVQETNCHPSKHGRRERQTRLHVRAESGSRATQALPASPPRPAGEAGGPNTCPHAARDTAEARGK